MKKITQKFSKIIVSLLLILTMIVGVVPVQAEEVSSITTTSNNVIDTENAVTLTKEETLSKLQDHVIREYARKFLEKNLPSQYTDLLTSTQAISRSAVIDIGLYEARNFYVRSVPEPANLGLDSEYIAFSVVSEDSTEQVTLYIMDLNGGNNNYTYHFTADGSTYIRELYLPEGDYKAFFVADNSETLKTYGCVLFYRTGTLSLDAQASEEISLTVEEESTPLETTEPVQAENSIPVAQYRGTEIELPQNLVA